MLRWDDVVGGVVLCYNSVGRRSVYKILVEALFLLLFLGSISLSLVRKVQMVALGSEDW